MGNHERVQGDHESKENRMKENMGKWLGRHSLCGKNSS